MCREWQRLKQQVMQLTQDLYVLKHTVVAWKTVEERIKESNTVPEDAMINNNHEEKESWIEKLIKLLNEYEEWKWEFTSMWLLYAWDVRDKWANIILKSKEYWFIQRLAENDKIDFNKRPELYTFKAETETRWLNNMVDGSWHYESLLMLLSIQDEPIGFLLSILK